MSMQTVASESVVVLLCRRFSRTASSSAVISTSFPFTSSSSCLAELQVPVLCCLLPSLAMTPPIHIPKKPDISAATSQNAPVKSYTGFAKYILRGGGRKQGLRSTVVSSYPCCPPHWLRHAMVFPAHWLPLQGIARWFLLGEPRRCHINAYTIWHGLEMI